MLISVLGTPKLQTGRAEAAAAAVWDRLHTEWSNEGERGAKVRFFTVNLLLHRHQVPRGEILLAWREVRNYRHSSDLCNSILFAGSRASHMVDYFLLQFFESSFMGNGEILDQVEKR